MGPLLFTGLALFGATIGLGRLATGAIRGASPAVVGSPLRRLAIIAAAFITGLGILGVVVGLLAVTTLRTDPTGGLLLVALAGVGATIGQLPVIRAGDEIDGSIAGILRMFVGSLVTLSLVVAILAATIGRSSGPSPDALPLAILGALAACGSIGLGIAGARGLRTVAGLPDGLLASQAASAAISRIVPFEGLAVVATAVAIFLVSTAR